MKVMDVNEWCKFLNEQEGTELSKKVESINTLLSWGDFSVKYMQHDSTWLYEKLIGYKRGEEPIPVPPMTEDEIIMFKNGLLDLSEEIKRVAEAL